MLISRRPLVLLAALLATLVVAGCSNEPLPTTPDAPSGSAPAAAPDAAAIAQADVDFARMMLPHHEQALVLSDLVEERSTNDDVDSLAFRIDREQVEEVGQMQGFLRLRGAPPAPDMGAMTGMDGMASPQTLDQLRASSGAEFNRLWLQTMIAHHEGAVTMSRDYLSATGGAGALAEFARTVERSQQAEIDEMEGALRAT